MHELITQKLREIEASEHIRILHCVESGSRAWGFASPDSDFDVRFIYVREPAFYLRLDKTRDVIEWQLDATLDMNGWDLQKALRLLHTSNPTLFEWNQSPIVYKTTSEWEQVRRVINRFFLAKSGIHHYRSTASGNFPSCQQPLPVLYYLPIRDNGKDGDNACAEFILCDPKERAGRWLKAARIVRGKFTPEPLR